MRNKDKRLLVIIVLILAYHLVPFKASADCSPSCRGNAGEVARCIAESTSCPQGDPSILPVTQSQQVVPPSSLTDDTPQELPAADSEPLQKIPVSKDSTVRPLVPRITLVKPTLSCQYDNTYYFPGQKRYECLSPRERGDCDANAGYGIPFICDATGNWGVGNEALAECSDSCPAQEQRVDCFGEIAPLCTGGSEPAITATWNITPVYGESSCNIFIRDGFGDHILSNDCEGSWSGSEIDSGDRVVNGGDYNLYISNGSDSCYNQYVSSVQPVCAEVNERSTEEYFFDPLVDWLSEWF